MKYSRQIEHFFSKARTLFYKIRSFFTLDKRFFFSILILTLIPLFLVEFFSLSSLFQSKIQNSKKEILNERVDDIDTYMDSLHMVIENLIHHDQIKDILVENENKDDIYHQLRSQEKIGSILSNYIQLQDILFIDLFSTDGSHYHVGDTLSTEGINNVAVTQLKDFARHNTTSTIFWSGLIPNYYVRSPVTSIIAVVSPIYTIDPLTLQEYVIGHLMIALDPTVFQKMDPYKNENNARILIVDNEDIVIYSSQYFSTGDTISQETVDRFQSEQSIHSISFDNVSYIFSQGSLSNTNWKVYVFFPVKLFLKDLYRIGYRFFIVFLISSIALYFYFLRFSKKYIRPIRKLTQHFIEYNQGKSLRPLKRSQRTYEEIGDLITWFNQYTEDLASKKAAEEKLAQSLLKQKHLVTCITETILQLDYDGTILFANPAWKNISGYNIENCIGKTFISFVYVDHRDTFFSAFQEVVDHQKDGITAKFQIVREDANLSWVEIHFTMMNSESGKSIVGVLSDITERIRIDALRDEFINTVSHELRTPLCAIKESLYLIKQPDTGSLSDIQTHLLGITLRNIDRLSLLINNVLDYQKYQSETKHITLYLENMNDTVQEAISLMEPIAKQKGLKLDAFLDYSIPLVMFNKDSILQVCINLINNAIKFTEKGSITLRTQLFDAYIRVCVEDTGIGIPPDRISSLFESFYQVSKSQPNTIKGTGLGLSICKKIITMHNGNIGVEGCNEHGSCFFFTIPTIVHPNL
ncbi:MAG: ATP-binding protein [Caldisericia bacterium]|nr:ATP-binding protein [Caldisericia bacterium]